MYHFVYFSIEEITTFASEADWSNPEKICKLFEIDLIDFVESLRIWEEVVEILPNYDYSRAKVFLVTSVPGTHSKHKLYRYGHMRMRFLLSKFSFIQVGLYIFPPKLSKKNFP